MEALQANAGLFPLQRLSKDRPPQSVSAAKRLKNGEFAKKFLRRPCKDLIAGPSARFIAARGGLPRLK
ncbi:hypothetical protein RA20_14205 [Leisingera sp. ANG-Vp]|nr:hypothetical protein RA20_14205 [Leisingera sp. ANG-Vp]